MNASASMRAAGFAAQLITDGETLGYSTGQVTSTVQAIVHRGVVKGKDFFASLHGAPVDFDILGLSCVEIAMTDIPAQPEAGHIFTDAIGFRHRVRMVANTDITWQAYCAQSKVS